jgi:hypothetical protein
MKKFEYRILNLSDVEKMNHENVKAGRPKTDWLKLMNTFGNEGWEYTGTKPTSQSFLLKREVF